MNMSDQDLAQCIDPSKMIARLRANPCSCSPDDVAHLLALLDHQDAQLIALRARVSAGPATPRPGAAPVESICQEADRIVSNDRQSTYGHPRDDFSRTASMWEAILGLPPGAIDPEQVAMCMIAVKLSRLCNKYSRDTMVDIAGYAKCIDLCRQAAPQD